MRNEDDIKKAIDDYGDMIQKICFIHMKQQCDVDDVFQTVFLKYAQHTEILDPEHEKAWIIRVTMNACKDRFRTWYHKKVELCDIIETYPQRTKSDYTYILEAVMTLPKNYRNALYLFYYEGYKVKEISAILHKKENTIHTWLKRSKELLKDILGGDVDALR